MIKRTKAALSLYVEVKGNGAPIVFFHGWGFDHSIWYHLLPFLTNHYQCYLVDLPGFGQTGLMDWQTFKQQLLTLLPPQFALVGWSMGGLFAMRLALEENKRVSHLLLVASSPCFIKKQYWPGIERQVLEDFSSQLITDPQKTIEQFIHLQTKIASESVILNAVHSATSPCKIQGLQKGLEPLSQWDFRIELKQYQQPMSLIFGRLDAIVPAKTMTIMQQHYPSFHYYLLRKAAHIPFLSHTTEFLSILRKLKNE